MSWGAVKVAALMAVAFVAGSVGKSVAGRTEKILNRIDDRVYYKDAASVYADNFNSRPVPVKCPPKQGTMVALLVGQSNAANHAQAKTTAGPRVAVLYNGSCFRAEDPLLGATGRGGSVWPTFADRVVASGAYEHVLLVPAAVGGSRMEAWSPGGVLSSRISERLAWVSAAGYRPTHVLVQQGESEGRGNADPDAYRRSASQLLAHLKGTGAEVIMATASTCNGPINEGIRLAQRAAMRASGVAPGPDADTIDAGHRINFCHYDAAAQIRMGRLWADSTH